MSKPSHISPDFVDKLMVNILGGYISMKDDRTDKTWSVELPPFYLAKFPVTQAFYQAVTGHNPSVFKGNHYPVENISWLEAVDFCNQLSLLLQLTPYYIRDQQSGDISVNQSANGFRLPSEAEWQYACQAGEPKIRYGDLDQIAWYKTNSLNRTHEVGQKIPNAWGLYDMLGNVWEWCSDIYDASVYGSYRIFRGGGWCDEARSVMATTRRRSHPQAFKIDDLGFRIARNIMPE